MSQASVDLLAKRDRLVETLRGCGCSAVAFSGGVDSAVVAKAAQVALGDRAVAATAVGASLAAGELEAAIELAQRIGIRHVVIQTDEFANAKYVQNATDRCFHCKTELYSQLEQLQAKLGFDVIANGANIDDQGDYRPGMQAAREHHVRSPLVECGFSKDDVRTLAAHWQLEVWDKPASPCLSSRVAYGEEVTPERLAMIDAAEQHLRGLGIRMARVRYHRGDVARIEVPVDDVARLCEESVRAKLVESFKALGFRFITLDLEGFRSGSLNAMAPAGALLQLE